LNFVFIIYYSANPDLNTPSEFFTDFFSLLTNIEKKQKKTFEIGKPWAEKKPGFVHLNNIVIRSARSGVVYSFFLQQLSKNKSRNSYTKNRHASVSVAPSIYYMP